MNLILLSTVYVVLLNGLLTLLLIWMLRRLRASLATLTGFAAIALIMQAALLLFVQTRPAIVAGLKPVPFFIILGLGVVAVAAAIMASPVGRTLASGGQRWLLLPQGLRTLFGAGFLVEGAYGIMPVHFAVSDGLTHIVAGTLALMTAWGLAQNVLGARAVWLAHLFGLLDIIVVATGIAFVLLPEIGPYHNIMIAAFFAAPIFVTLHLMGLVQLLRSPAPLPELRTA
jgi:hypothetical protein